MVEPPISREFFYQWMVKYHNQLSMVDCHVSIPEDMCLLEAPVIHCDAFWNFLFCLSVRIYVQVPPRTSRGRRRGGWVGIFLTGKTLSKYCCIYWSSLLQRNGTCSQRNPLPFPHHSPNSVCFTIYPFLVYPERFVAKAKMLEGCLIAAVHNG